MILTAIRYLSAFVLLISLFPNSVALAEADHLSPSAVPLREKADTEIFHKDFSGHLAEFRSLAQRKDAVEKEYVRLAQIMRDVQLEQAKVDAEIKGLQSRGINHENANHTLRVAVERDLLVLSRTSAKAMLDFLVEEYDILSRLEELDVMRKANAITASEYLSENRSLREALFHQASSRQLERLNMNLNDRLLELRRGLIGIR